MIGAIELLYALKLNNPK